MSRRTGRLAPDQRAALDRLVEQDVLSQEQITAVLDALGEDRETQAPHHGWVWEVVGYLGGALVVGGAGLLLWRSWEQLPQAARVGLLAAATLVLLGAGTVIAGGPRGVGALNAGQALARTRIVAVLYALASAVAAMTVSSAVNVAEGPSATLVGLLVAALGYLAVPSIPGLLATGGFSIGAVLAICGEWFSSSTPSITIGLIALGAVWAALALAGALFDDTVGLAGGAVIALGGAQWPVSSDQGWWGYGLTVLVALLCFAGYVWLGRAVALVVLGVLGITVAVPEAIWDWTGGSLGGPLMVLIVGLAFLVAAWIGLRLRRTRTTETATSEH